MKGAEGFVVFEPVDKLEELTGLVIEEAIVPTT